MDILYLLIPLSAVLVLAIIGVFGWALHQGQFEELAWEGRRILQAEGDESPAFDVEQGPGAVAAEQSLQQ